MSKSFFISRYTVCTHRYLQSLSQTVLLFYISPLSHFVRKKNPNNMIPVTKRTIILLNLLLIIRKSNALMKIYVPTLQCKNNHFLSEPRKHCQKTAIQNTLCSLELPSGPPLIHFPANPAGLLFVFLSYTSPGEFTVEPHRRSF